MKSDRNRSAAATAASAHSSLRRSDAIARCSLVYAAAAEAAAAAGQRFRRH